MAGFFLFLFPLVHFLQLCSGVAQDARNRHLATFAGSDTKVEADPSTRAIVRSTGHVAVVPHPESFDDLGASGHGSRFSRFPFEEISVVRHVRQIAFIV